jgi:hypothetical protein
MKVEGGCSSAAGAFSGARCVVYWYTTHGPTGITALALAVGWRCSPGSYVLFTDRRLRKRPEDDNLGEIRQGTSGVGFFTCWCWTRPPGRCSGGAGSSPGRCCAPGRFRPADASVAAALAGVSGSLPPLTVTGAALVVSAVLAHAASL